MAQLALAVLDAVPDAVVDGGWGVDALVGRQTRSSPRPRSRGHCRLCRCDGRFARTARIHACRGRATGTRHRIARGWASRRPASGRADVHGHDAAASRRQAVHVLPGRDHRHDRRLFCAMHLTRDAVAHARRVRAGRRRSRRCRTPCGFIRSCGSTAVRRQLCGRASRSLCEWHLSTTCPRCAWCECVLGASRTRESCRSRSSTPSTSGRCGLRGGHPSDIHRHDGPGCSSRARPARCMHMRGCVQWTEARTLLRWARCTAIRRRGEPQPDGLSSAPPSSSCAQSDSVI